MPIQPSEFVRKPFVVKAIMVNPENIEEVAKWCGGEVRTSDTSADGGMEGFVQYIKVRVKNPIEDRQTRAYYGDWVLAAGKGYKVYTAPAFAKAFVPHVRPASQPNRRGRGNRPVPSAPAPAVHVDVALVEKTRDHGFPGEPVEMREEVPEVLVVEARPAAFGPRNTQ